MRADYFLLNVASNKKKEPHSRGKTLHLWALVLLTGSHRCADLSASFTVLLNDMTLNLK